MQKINSWYSLLAKDSFKSVLQKGIHAYATSNNSALTRNDKVYDFIILCNFLFSFSVPFDHEDGCFAVHVL